jgi:hypothetical protein
VEPVQARELLGLMPMLKLALGPVLELVLGPARPPLLQSYWLV